ncbi:hypothetical protein CAEBREN_19359 [Caenorhabditis brenneri]|uniref:Uncharacterized protein n=1 Tax=Caenorhabditis brenneri TaxID=135651 RepID=G0NYS0_CAEBE|nr:hypothetical protein CAEBREN_19359 [Caenorhabditis brenneri]
MVGRLLTSASLIISNLWTSSLKCDFNLNWNHVQLNVFGQIATIDAVQNVEGLHIFMPFITQAKKDIMSYKKGKHLPARVHQAPLIIQCEKQRETVLAVFCALRSFESSDI